jgi:hypothetical protein
VDLAGALLRVKVLNALYSAALIEERGLRHPERRD